MNWVLKSEYDKASAQSNGNPSTLVTILNAAGALLPIISTTIQTVKSNQVNRAANIAVQNA